jgi:hypothetical protein
MLGMPTKRFRSPLLMIGLLAAATGCELGAPGPDDEKAALAHVSVRNASNEALLVRLTWPDGVTGVYEVEPDRWASTVNTIGVSSYPWPIEVLKPDCTLVGRVQGLGEQRTLVLISAELQVTVEPVTKVPGSTREVDGIDACDAHWPS